MAEARSAVAELRVPPDLEEGRDSWKDFLQATRKAVVRCYFRTRNSIRNGTWPTSTNNLITAFAIALGLLLFEPDPTKRLNSFLWDVGDFFYITNSAPRWLRAVLVAWIAGVVFFLVLMAVRQYLLRILLSYRGWMYEPLRTQSWKTRLWGFVVRLVSGYQPSLYSCQRSLPRLPVPNIQCTLERLYESLKPLCTASELEEIQRQGSEFLTVLGPKLQRILVLKSWWAPNYVSDWWEKYVYQMSRVPLAINSNYYGMDHSYWKPTTIQAARAAGVIYQLEVLN